MEMSLQEALALRKKGMRQLREFRSQLKNKGHKDRRHPIYPELWVVTADGKAFGLMFFEGAYSSYHEKVVLSPEAWQHHFEYHARQEWSMIDYATKHGLLGVL